VRYKQYGYTFLLEVSDHLEQSCCLFVSQELVGSSKIRSLQLSEIDFAISTSQGIKSYEYKSTLL